MASNYTENYGLCQWEATDQVLRTEFNEDNRKVDEALSKLNCRVYTTGYTGDDSASRTFTFPHKPVFVVIIGGECLMVAIRDYATANFLNNHTVHRNISVTWGENSISWACDTNYPIYSVNSSARTYQLLALMEIE